MKAFLFPIFVALSTLGHTQQPYDGARMFADTPENHYFYETFAVFHAHKLGGFWSHIRSLDEKTYNSFAKSTETCILTLDKYLSSRLKELKVRGPRNSSDSLSEWQIDESWFAFVLPSRLGELIEKFVDPSDHAKKLLLRMTLQENQLILSQLVSVCRKRVFEKSGKQPFADVPPNHWASQAVQELGLEGILLGYKGKRLPEEYFWDYHEASFTGKKLTSAKSKK